MTDGTTTPEDATPESSRPGPTEEDRRRLREALERKKGAQHPDDGARGGGAGRGTTPATTRREFRRKSG